MGNIEAKPFANVDLYHCMILKHSTRSRSSVVCNLLGSLNKKEQVSICEQVAKEASKEVSVCRMYIARLKMKIEKGEDKQKEVMLGRLEDYLADLQKTAYWIGEGIKIYCAKQLEVLHCEMTALEAEIKYTLTGLETEIRKSRNKQAQAFEKRLLVRAKHHRAITTGRNYICRKTNRTLKH